MKILRTYSSVVLVALAMALIFSSSRASGQNKAPVPKPQAAKPVDAAKPAQTAKPAQAVKPAESARGNVENGKRVYFKYGCFQCHGGEGQGGNAGSRLGPNPVPLEVFIDYTRTPAGGEMPPYKAKIVSDQELIDMYAFMETRPHSSVKNIPLLK
jgi:mono/diheme cytochrome c family protein